MVLLTNRVEYWLKNPKIVDLDLAGTPTCVHTCRVFTRSDKVYKILETVAATPNPTDIKSKRASGPTVTLDTMHWH